MTSIYLKENVTYTQVHETHTHINTREYKKQTNSFNTFIQETKI